MEGDSETTIWTCELSGGPKLLDEFERALSQVSQRGNTTQNDLPPFKYALLLRNTDNSVIASAFTGSLAAHRATAESDVRSVMTMLMRTKVYQPPPFALQVRTRYVRDLFERGASLTIIGTVDANVGEPRFDWAVSEVDFLINRATYRCVVEAHPGDATGSAALEPECRLTLGAEFD